MSHDSLKLLFRLFNIWLAFVMLLFISSNFPHWENVQFHTWINVAFYFLMFLLSGAIAFRDKNNRDIFINLMIFLLANSLTFVNFFIGNNYLFGNDHAMYRFYVFKLLMYCFFFNFFIIYTSVKYWLSFKAVWKSYLVTFLIFLPFFVLIFYPYLKDVNYVFTIRDHYIFDLYQKMFFIHLLSLFFVIVYFYVWYIKDANMGEYINLLMTFFFIFLVFEIIGFVSEVYQLIIYHISQYIITINLLFISIILIKRMLFLSSEYGQFFEALIRQKIPIGKLKIQRSRSEINALLLQLLKLYLKKRWKYILSIMWMLSIAFSYFQFPGYVTLNIAAYLVCTMVLIWFASILYQRRAKRKFTLT